MKKSLLSNRCILLRTPLAFDYESLCVAVLNTILHFYFISRVNQLL